MTTQCDYLINVPVIKSHNLCGITGALKNYYGAIAIQDTILHNFNPIKSLVRAEKVHANNCNPQIAVVASHPLIRKKTRLHIADALVPMYDGGPYGPPQWINGQLLISQDPVAIDYQAFQIIERKRQEKGLESQGLSLRAKYIQSAAEMKLGTNHPNQMEIMDITL